MTLLRAIGTGLCAALITALAFFGGFVFSVISVVVSVAISVGGIFFIAFMCVAAANSGDEDKRD
jgi:arginine exporter protein ArgO